MLANGYEKAILGLFVCRYTVGSKTSSRSSSRSRELLVEEKG